MPIISKFSKFFSTIFFITFINSLSLSAMEKSNSNFFSEIEKQFSKITSWFGIKPTKPDTGEFKTISEMASCMGYLKLFQESLHFKIPIEINNRIGLDFFYVKTVQIIEVCLEKNLKNPKAVLMMIDDLYTTYGHALSVFLLSMALKNTGLTIGDIADENGVNCLLIVTCKASKQKQEPYMPSIKIILDIAGNEAFDLISKTCFPTSSQNYSPKNIVAITVLHDELEIFSLFLKFACDKDKLWKLLFNGKNKTFHVFDMILYCNRTDMLKKVLDQAEKLEALEELILMKSASGRNFYILKSYALCLTKATDCFDIIISYCEKYQLDELLGQLINFRNIAKMMSGLRE